MKRKGTVLVMYDAPSDAEFEAWMHGPHYDEVMNTPGVIAARRYEVIDPPAGQRRYIALIESNDLDATLAWRSSPEGQRSQQEANERGVSNRYGLICRMVYSSVPGEAD